MTSSIPVTQATGATMNAIFVIIGAITILLPIGIAVAGFRAMREHTFDDVPRDTKPLSLRMSRRSRF